ncbi:PREDICTED: myb-like protein M [Priapulus caudatus]|uniref:Myb-like protein M n=1 Tax=Priapulus caudatus TaxID=37621 RepID=A0ABM1DYX8_PRICU|nr:PREDICTED: myb-like protein M [Priapulus caudatus]
MEGLLVAAVAAILLQLVYSSGYGNQGVGGYPGVGGDYYGNRGSTYGLPDRLPHGVLGPLISPYHNNINKVHAHGNKHGRHHGQNNRHAGNYYKDNGYYNDRNIGQYYNTQYNNRGDNNAYQNKYAKDFYGKHLNNNYVKGKAWGHSSFAPTAGLYYRKLFSPISYIPW